MIAPARVAAYRALQATRSEDVTLATALARAREPLTDERDRALAAQLTLGVLRWRNALDHFIAQLARRPVTKIDPQVLDILRLGVYQLRYLSRVPPAAVANDAVELTRAAGRASASGFVNAVLRSLVREPASVSLPERPREPTSPAVRAASLDYLSVALSHPAWLVGRWMDRHGFQAAERWAEFNNSAAPLTIRANRLRTDRETLAASLAGLGVETEPTRYAPDGLVVTRRNPLGTRLEAEGAFIVQDEASQLVSLMVQPSPGERILDACASPGGKALAIAAGVGPSGLLVAGDARLARIALLRSTLARGGAPRAPIVHLNLLEGLPFLEAFDAVLVDAPCSGLGTTRRDPDIRWRRTEDDLARFAGLEVRMLETAARGVLPGGRLVYATCSSEPEENEGVVSRFLARHPAYVLSDPRARGNGVPPGLAAALGDDGLLRTLPHVHGLEAFFAALMVRRR
jgi:16S rRNA (cytosine967-C5)-methyltransferase